MEPELQNWITVGGGGDPAALQSLRASLRGQLILPDDEGYDSARVVHNTMLDKKPALMPPNHGTPCRKLLML